MKKAFPRPQADMILFSPDMDSVTAPDNGNMRLTGGNLNKRSNSSGNNEKICNRTRGYSSEGTMMNSIMCFNRISGKPAHRDGYILAWVIYMLLIVSLLSGVMITVSLASTQGVLAEHYMTQAYYTAKSAASAAAAVIAANSSDDALIGSMMAVSGTGSIEGMGSYTVGIVYTGADRIKILAEADYKGYKASVSAHLVKPPPSGILPTDNVIYLNGPADTGIGQCTLNGSIYIDGNLVLSYGSLVSGFAIVKGTTMISGAGNSTSGLFSAGNVYLDNGGLVAGDLLSKGDLSMLGSSWVTGNATADGSLDMSSGSSVIAQNALIGSNAFFDGGGNRIYGTFSYGGSITCGWGTITSFVPLGATHITDYVPVDDRPYISPPLPVIPAPGITVIPEMYNQVILNGDIINASGTINASVVAQLNSKPYGSTVTIDTSVGNINLLLDATLFSLSNGLNIEVDGPNNVYLYMTGSSSIYVNSNEYIGMKIRGTNPRLFIFGDGAQTIRLDNNSELNACVYIPNGSLVASGSALDTYKFIGSCTVKSANISNDVSFFYSSSEIEGTPLEILQTGLEEYAANPWKIESWDNR